MRLTDVQRKFIDNKLEELNRSKFRRSFCLRKKEIEYINNKGMDLIYEHALTFVETRLAPALIINDGKQTPMKGHPVFIAQHATATCCRGCLEKWHHISKGRELSDKEIRFVVALIICWIEKM